MKKRLSVKGYYNRLSKKDKEKLVQIEHLCKTLMQLHNVGHFKFKYGISRKYSGQCSTDTITLEMRFVIRNDNEQIKNTIMHEIAQAIIGAGFGHRKEWQDKARELGVTWRINYRE